MPLFVYICEKCNETKELLRRIADANKVVFCDCGEQMEPAWGKPAKMIRGSGNWSSPA